MRTSRPWRLLLAVALPAAALDVATKDLAWRLVPCDAGTMVIPGVVRFFLHSNTGAAWGMFPGRNAAFIALSVAALVLLPWLLLRSGRPRALTVVAVGLILGGTMGNLYDRLAFGHVRDFIDFYTLVYPAFSFGEFRFRWARGFPVFNGADSWITIGAVLFFFATLKAPAEDAAPAGDAPPRP
jgi:signal peptidase II